MRTKNQRLYHGANQILRDVSVHCDRIPVSARTVPDDVNMEQAAIEKALSRIESAKAHLKGLKASKDYKSAQRFPETSPTR